MPSDSKNPAVAICVSGQLRHFESCAPHLNNRIEEIEARGFDVDLFLSTWNERGMHPVRDKLNSNFAGEFLSAEYISKIYNNLQAIEIIPFDDKFYNQIEDVNLQKFPNIDPKTLTSALPMYFLIYRSLLLLIKHQNRTGRQYQRIIRVRPDIVVKEIDISCLTDHIMGFDDRRGELWDYFFWGYPNEMKTAMALFEKMNDYFQELNEELIYNADCYKRYRGSMLFRKHVTQHNMKIFLNGKSFGWIAGGLGFSGILWRFFRKTIFRTWVNLVTRIVRWQF